MIITDEDRATMRNVSGFPLVQHAYIAGLRAGLERAAATLDELHDDRISPHDAASIIREAAK